MRAWVKYVLSPPGMDKTCNKEVNEMLMLEEYDLSKSTFTIHRIVFRYVDGTTGEPVKPAPSWAPATAGNKKTLEFLRFQNDFGQ